MRDGFHGFPGAHNHTQVRDAIEVRIGDASVNGGKVDVEFEIINRGAGHHFPTTATPAAVVILDQVGREGALSHTSKAWVIARTVRHEDGAWHELSDTRIPAGSSFVGTYAAARDPRAEGVELRLWFFPDWHYAGLFQRLLDGRPDKRSPLLRNAQAEAETSGFIVTQIRRPLKAGRVSH